MAFPKPSRSDSYRARQGLHVINTAARSLDQAIDKIFATNSGNRSASLRKARGPTLRQEFAMAKSRARFQKLHGQISLPGGIKNTPEAKFVKKKRSLVPHPFRGFDDAQKSKKIAEMISSGCWGVGPSMYRRLAKLFDVPIGAIAAIHHQMDYNGHI